MPLRSNVLGLFKQQFSIFFAVEFGYSLFCMFLAVFPSNLTTFSCVFQNHSSSVCQLVLLVLVMSHFQLSTLIVVFISQNLSLSTENKKTVFPVFVQHSAQRRLFSSFLCLFVFLSFLEHFDSSTFIYFTFIHRSKRFSAFQMLFQLHLARLAHFLSSFFNQVHASEQQKSREGELYICDNHLHIATQNGNVKKVQENQQQHKVIAFIFFPFHFMIASE